MTRIHEFWATPQAHLLATRPDHPVLYFAPRALQAMAARFLEGFPGLVTYAVKANDAVAVLENLAAAGITGFDVASPTEMERVAATVPGAVMHYNNPVRSRAELRAARAHGIRSFAVDDAGELAKLAETIPAGAEVSVRLKLPVAGGHYDLGSKFGATEAGCAGLLRRAAAAGFTPSMTFHPGTQCTDPAAWVAYIAAAARVARAAGMRLARLNVGGGFPAHRVGDAPDLQRIFDSVAQAVRAGFGADAPDLVCEPGRALVAEAMVLATRVKAIRADGAVWLNDGIYGGLQEFALVGAVDRIRVLAPDGRPRRAAGAACTVFGPTCDSLDRVRGPVALPGDIAEGDYVLFEGMGGYSTATATRFNGYGRHEIVSLA